MAAMAWPSAAQQEGPGRLPFPQLTRYLELTPEQRNGLLRIQAEWQRYLAQKQQRVTQVERELYIETNQPVPDPLSLGVRYAELEAICREARAKEDENIRAARRLLTAAQLSRLQTLEAAYALMPVIAEADQAGLMRAPLAGPPALAPAADAAVAGIITARNYPGCRYPPRPVD